jgi:hypothetical protein
VLLDAWVVRQYRGEPRGLDGQALRWVTQDELAGADLLAADKPIVAALRLPERLTEASSPYYRVGDLDAMQRSSGGAEAARNARLQGVFCRSLEEGIASAGADFLVMRGLLADDELTRLCEAVAVPVFARGIALERAWALGASGLNEVNA